MSLQVAHLTATVGAAFLLTTAFAAPASAMLAPFDPAPASVFQGPATTTTFCFMGHDVWPASQEPPEPCS